MAFSSLKSAALGAVTAQNTSRMPGVINSVGTRMETGSETFKGMEQLPGEMGAGKAGTLELSG